MAKINTNIFWMGIVSFFTDMASSLVMPLLPFFIVIILDQGVDKLGVVLAVTTIASYLLRFVGGIASDKLDSNKRFLIFGYGLSALAKPFLSVADDTHQVGPSDRHQRRRRQLHRSRAGHRLRGSNRRDAASSRGHATAFAGEIS